MSLVTYSDSEASEDDSKPVTKPIRKTGANSAKPAFQKIIDRSNPHKILVNLPEHSESAGNESANGDGPPAKRVKTGLSGFSGFNSLLPAPKRALVANGSSATGTARKGGLGAGVNLKTGATPGFSREPVVEKGLDEAGGDAAQDESFGGERSAPVDHDSRISGALFQESPQPSLAKEEPRKQGNVMMFKPLSVARKPAKKKKNPTPENFTTTTAPSENGPPKTHAPAKPSPKVSLFSMDALTDFEQSITPSNGDYQPLIYSTQDNPATSPTSNSPPLDAGILSPSAEPSLSTPHPQSSTHDPPGPQSLDSIASDLNLSASAKRQLLGRHHQRNNNNNTSKTGNGPSASAVKIVNFNTDQEYASNELLRQAGEQVQHNPVRAIAPGKHSLKQLVNAASNQKDALEEQFASGRRNKKEAGSKYGW
ncbi:hypothetical protein MMC20_000067 [Loxospora ochrophaea]|nr:hypothetical protein [Loxospora ochrophaea]